MAVCLSGAFSRALKQCQWKEISNYFRECIAANQCEKDCNTISKQFGARHSTQPTNQSRQLPVFPGVDSPGKEKASPVFLKEHGSATEVCKTASEPQDL